MNQHTDTHAQRARRLSSEVQRLRDWAGGDPARLGDVADALNELTAHRLAAHAWAEAAPTAQEAVMLSAKVLAQHGPVGPYTPRGDAARSVTALVHLAVIQSAAGLAEGAEQTLSAAFGLRAQLIRLDLDGALNPATIAWALLAWARVALAGVYSLPLLPAALLRRLGIADEPCLLMAARIVPAKGHDTALRALARLTDQPWTLLVAGDHHGDLGPQMQALAQELGIAGRVRFLGLREDVPALMAASDVLLAPSRREALSLTLLEASACGLPIVATRVGGIGEVVEEGASGFLVAPDDPPALAAALAPLLADAALRARCGARARQRFEEGFLEDAMFDKTVAVYQEACGGQR